MLARGVAYSCCPPPFVPPFVPYKLGQFASVPSGYLPLQHEYSQTGSCAPSPLPPLWMLLMPFLGREGVLWGVPRLGRERSRPLICIPNPHSQPSRRFPGFCPPLTDIGLQLMYEQHWRTATSPSPRLKCDCAYLGGVQVRKFPKLLSV